MKKGFALTALCMLVAGQAWAYENLQAGYSVQDKEPFYKMASSKIYAYSSFSANSLDKLEKMQRGSVNIVNYYTADEMTQILGEEFSTAYFDRQYEQIAVLQRSELDIRTVPCPLLDMERYAEKDTGKNIILQQYFQEQFQKLKPIIGITTVNGSRAIKISYLYKQMKSLIAVDTTLLSANDRLYMLTTVTADDKVFAAQNSEAATPDEEVSKSGDIHKRMGEAFKQSMKTENVEPSDVDVKVIKAIAKEHKRFTKGFKALTPQGSAKHVVLTDSVAQKNITLPQDWFYAQVQIREKEGAGTFTTAASLPTMQKIAKELDFVGIYGLLDANAVLHPNKPVEPAEPTEISDDADVYVDDSVAADQQQPASAEMSEAAKAKVLAETRKALSNFDAMLFTCSFKIKDKDFQEFIALPRTQSLETEIFLQGALERLKRGSDEYFALDDYAFDINYTKDKALVDINTKISVLKEFKFTNLLRLAAFADNSASALFYLHKSELPADEQIMQGIDEWQF